jgi:hypothetical protein
MYYKMQRDEWWEQRQLECKEMWDKIVGTMLDKFGNKMTNNKVSPAAQEEGDKRPSTTLQPTESKKEELVEGRQHKALKEGVREKLRSSLCHNKCLSSQE